MCFFVDSDFEGLRFQKSISCRLVLVVKGLRSITVDRGLIDRDSIDVIVRRMGGGRIGVTALTLGRHGEAQARRVRKVRRRTSRD